MTRIRFALLLAVALLLVVAGAVFAQPSTVSYQGQLSVSGAPFDGNAAFKFAVLCGAPGSHTSAWSNDGTSTGGSEPSAAVTLAVAQGLFSTRLGDATAGMVPLGSALIEGCANPVLRVWVDTGTGFEQLADQPFASAPFALKAGLADGALGLFTVRGGPLKVADEAGDTTIAMFADTGEISVNAVRFADNTVQTTAGGGGSDGDWNVAGVNMSSAVAGNVGIGTAAPDRKLHVSGGSDIDSAFNGGYLRIGPATTGNLLFDNNEIQAVSNGAANNLGINVEGGSVGIGTVNPSSRLHVLGSVRADGTGGFDVRNPNNTGAISRFDWNLDLARIRVGGAGTGSNNGFDIQGTSDTSLLRILNNGNVGLGTTTPTARLDVAGNAVIQGNLTVQGAITGGGGTQYLSLGPQAFLESRPGEMDIERDVRLSGLTPGQGLRLYAQVDLPHGATVTRVEVFGADFQPAANPQNSLNMILGRTPLTGGFATGVAVASSAGAPGEVVLDSGPRNIVIDNLNHQYAVIVNWDTPSPPRLVSDLRVYGARITYTLP